jgi:hypothetical protein
VSRPGPDKFKAFRSFWVLIESEPRLGFLFDAFYLREPVFTRDRVRGSFLLEGAPTK